ncbi:MAG: heme exporter protein CcmB [Planctomycetota bacterium]
MGAVRAYWDFLRWDLRREFKRLDTLGAMLLFSLITLMIFSFAIRPDSETAVRVRAGVLWITYLLAGTIGVDRAMRSSDEKVLEGLLLAPVARSVIFYARLSSTWILVVLMEAIILAAFCLLYNVALSAGAIAQLALVGGLVTVNFVAVGLTIAAMTRAIHGGEVFLRILLFPLMIPVFSAAVEATTAIFAGAELKLNPFVLIGATLLVYVGAGQLMFDQIFSDYDGG